jgi:hypothetical protein
MKNSIILTKQMFGFSSGISEWGWTARNAIARQKVE